MRTITVKQCIYKYDELSDKAKEFAKQLIIDDPFRNDEFYDEVLEQINCDFPNSKMKVQYSLSSCQGDGLNLYGTVNPIDFISKFECNEIERSALCYLFSKYDLSIKLSHNERYCYCIINDERILFLLEDKISDIDITLTTETKELLKKYFKFISHTLSEFCKEWENYGYEYLYNVSEDEASDFYCDTEFYEDGRVYGYIEH